MSFPDITADLRAQMPELRGHFTANEPLAPYTWFRVGGPAQALFMPADEDDLVYFLQRLPSEIPVTVIGLGSNLIVRDGGVAGVVIRLSAKGFGGVAVREGYLVTVGAAVPDVKAARAAAEAGIDGLAFFRGIPGCIGGALRMNAGAHGGETRDALIEAHGVTRSGERVVFRNADMGFSYRHSEAPEDVIFTRGTFQGRPAIRRPYSPRWIASRRRAKPRSRSERKRAARPSRIPKAIRLGSWWTPPDVAGLSSATLR